MTAAPAGWYPDPENPELSRYWDGSQWTVYEHPLPPPPADTAAEQESAPSPDLIRIAHDLAMVYLHNRYGAEVAGRFQVSSSEDSVSGEGEVWTTRLPSPDTPRMVKVGTGERYAFGLLEKKKWVATGRYEVDADFAAMIDDYDLAYERFLGMLQHRAQRKQSDSAQPSSNSE